MKPVPYTPFVAPPRVLRHGEGPPRAIVELTLRELCAIAGIPCRVTTPHTPAIRVHAGAEHLQAVGALYVGIAGGFDRTPVTALRVLEVLAHGFHDYGARECVCGRGLFVTPRRRGRPPRWGRPMTAAERARHHRR